MNLNITDWLVIILYFLIILYAGYRFRKSENKSLGDFFLSGRNLPWYIAGFSMIASTFTVNNPVAITEFVSRKGISGNWIWWSMLAGGTFTTFFLSGLWRRANILTEIEFIELRYGGKTAAFLRGFKSVYLALFLNMLTITWINVSMIILLKTFFNLHNMQLFLLLAGVMLITVAYTILSGLKSVAFTHVFQFAVAFAGSVLFACILLSSYKISGITGLKMHLSEISPDYLNFFPKISGKAGAPLSTLTFTVTALLAYVGVQWWSSWSPDNEPGGGGYLAQRMMSVKTEKESVMATLFYQVVHYAVRPWPWIITGLCIIILYPDAGGSKTGYFMAIKDYVPYGLTGLVLISFLGIYMSIISTQLNLGASYLVNDLYKRFIVREKRFLNNDKKESHYILVSRLVIIFLTGISLYITTLFDSLTDIWEFMLAACSGIGLVLILRWFWWRINVWSEISAIVFPFILIYFINKLFRIDFPVSLFIITGGTMLVWLIITYLTPPENKEVLKVFCQKIKPVGFWGKYSRFTKKYPGQYILALFMSWISSIIMIYSLTFFAGKLIFGDYISAFGWMLSAIIYFAFLRGAMRVIFKPG
jgi:SSS family solute:Na+ symporter